VQREFAAYHDDDSGLPLHMRIGLHTGEPIRDEDDFFGKHVILAARIAAEAKGDEILVSSLLKELLESSGEVSFSNERVVELKGLAGSHRVFAVSEREVAEPALA
jgi:class 3 adenylate cyclase